MSFISVEYEVESKAVVPDRGIVSELVLGNMVFQKVSIRCHFNIPRQKEFARGFARNIENNIRIETSAPDYPSP